MAKCPACGSVIDKLSNLNEGNTNVKGKLANASHGANGNYKGAGSKLKSVVGARPNPANGKPWRTSGRKIMD